MKMKTLKNCKWLLRLRAYQILVKMNQKHQREEVNQKCRREQVLQVLEVKMAILRTNQLYMVNLMIIKKD